MEDLSLKLCVCVLHGCVCSYVRTSGILLYHSGLDNLLEYIATLASSKPP